MPTPNSLHISRKFFWRVAPHIASLPILSQLLQFLSEWNRSNNGSFLFCPINPLIRHRYTNAYQVESLFTNYIKVHALKEDVFLDIGACIGTFSFLAASRCKHVFAVDGSPLNLSILLNTLSLNNITNITPIQTLLLSSPQSLFSSIPVSGRFGVAEISPDPPRSSYNKSYFNIQSCTSNQLFTSLFVKPTILKVDIDGYEYDFLSSLDQIHFATIHTILIEVNDSKVSNLLEHLGFSLTAQQDPNCVYIR